MGLVLHDGAFWMGTVAGAEAHRLEAVRGDAGCGVRAVRIVEGLQGSCPAAPEGAERTKHHKGKRVADEEL